MLLTPTLPLDDPADVTHDAELGDLGATRALAARVAARARIGDVVGLAGALGAGKTTFARFFIFARAGRELEVPSPTFSLVQPYALAEATVWHFDLYRIGAPDEALELGIEDAFVEGISLIEWPERLGHFLPDDRLDIAFHGTPASERRRVRLCGRGSWAARVRDVAA
jgi:tRNA threonylcarbamoyladenosine biosynthesis protein TsaE